MSDAMKEKVIEIIDRGRGPQLSTSRITVLDLVHYFQDGFSHDEIIRWIPSLTHEEVAVIDRYYQEHKAEFDEKEQRVQEVRAEQIRLQRLRFPEIEETREQCRERLTKLLAQRIQEKNGVRPSG
jgi:uncharacterized protein (DUF433 family)